MANIHIINSFECWLKSLDTYNIHYWKTLKPIGKFKSIFRSIKLRFNKNYILEYYDYDFVEKIAQDDIIILFDCMCQQEVMSRISNKCKNNRKILFYWNPLPESKHSSINYDGWEVWTFDPKDAKKFNIRYAGQFVDDSLLSNIISGKGFDSDLYFVGIDKGRFTHLNQLVANLSPRIRLKFRMVSPLKCLYNKKYSPRLPYIKCLEEEKRSKAILEYAQNGQTGLTLRALEAIYFQRKLVTNNPDISRYIFYNPNNVFILKDDKGDGLYDFIHSPFVKYENHIRNIYCFSNWLDRLVNNIELRDYE